MNTEQIIEFINKIKNNDDIEDHKKALVLLETIINDKKVKHNKNINNYRSKEENKEKIKNISKKSYDNLKTNDEKYQAMLDKKKKYYQENKARIQEKSKIKYNIVKQLLNDNKDKINKEQQKEQ